MSWKNQLIKAFLWLLSPEATRPRPERGEDHFLIVSTTALGDTLWATPAIKALRTTHPDAYIAVLTSPIGNQVLQHNKNIDEIFILEKPFIWSLIRLFRPLRQRHFDATVVFHASQRAVFPFLALLETPQLIGTKGMSKDLDFLFSHLLPEKRQHEIARRLDLVSEIGAKPHSHTLEFPLSFQADQAAKRFIDGHGIPEHIPLVALHPGAARAFKQWPKEHFIELGKRLHQHLGCQIFVTGSQKEALDVLDVASKIPHAIPMAGELSLEVFGALIKRLSLFISNDTGPMHLAFALETPTVAIFSPTDPELCGPYKAKNVRILSAPKTCFPCIKKHCNEPFCLLQIGPDQAYETALELYYANQPLTTW